VGIFTANETNAGIHSQLDHQAFSGETATIMSTDVVLNVTSDTIITVSKISEPKTVYKINDIAAFFFCSCEPQITIKRYIGHKITSNTMKNKTMSRVQKATTNKISKMIK
jgi:hypothetical protein